MFQKIRYFLFLVAVLVLIVVAFQNKHSVDVDVLTFSGKFPLALLLLATAVISFVLGSIMTAWRIRKKERAKARQIQADAKQAADKSAPPKKPESVQANEPSPLER
ncbi:Uncharacterized membrane protein YciS, DUF1049 family [Neorhodopirellula lusitana]|uniref:Uncharacterized membrane protein YciS, DUF1049 family n=1 Tax=Neorhodopirellula lusitana TaxID=445327 RepID=A0ABY1QI41_9BACT|nr:lipopolysaccharide assembly protein LapA domain-containing protein [Neorhodopirellula lusitana]SMP71570.1 Uncharacterized membrane protein YciS, DUF1049 family [Neorhodopirellula lusitana]